MHFVVPPVPGKYPQPTVLSPGQHCVINVVSFTRVYKVRGTVG